MNTKYGEDIFRTYTVNKYYQERLRDEPWVRLPAPRPSVEVSAQTIEIEQARPGKRIRFVPRGSAKFVWFGEQVQVEARGLLLKPNVAWKGSVFKFPFEEWVMIGKLPDDYQGPGLNVPACDAWCAIAHHNSKGGILRTMAGSPPVSVKDLRRDWLLSAQPSGDNLAQATDGTTLTIKGDWQLGFGTQLLNTMILFLKYCPTHGRPPSR